MAQNVTIAGATYSDVPAIDIPRSDGQGTARFYDPGSIQFPVTSVNNQTGDVELKTSDLANDSGYITGMTILSYGHSTWQDFLDAYSADKVVYCRASSNANPATGSQTRMAFMAYVNNAANPTNVEFQYYRSVNAHSATQQGDQVYVYKLDKNAGWTVTVRENYTKIVAGTGLSSSYSSGTLTLSTSNSDSSSIRYYTSQAVSVANNAEIFRITDSAITTDTICINITFADPSYITSDISWTSYAGYIAFTGTCIAATTADVIIAKKQN